jgi:hypothetical protein
LKSITDKYNTLKKRFDDLNNINSEIHTSAANSLAILNKNIYDTTQNLVVTNSNNTNAIANNNQNIITTLSNIAPPPPNYNSYQDIVKENTLLTTKINNIKDIYQLGDQKSYYEAKQNNYLLKLNTAFFWVYYIILILFTYVLFYIESSMSKYLKFAIVLLGICYPFIVTMIEQFLYKIYKMIESFIIVKPYNQ